MDSNGVPAHYAYCLASTIRLGLKLMQFSSLKASLYNSVESKDSILGVAAVGGDCRNIPTDKGS
jgi:hypothetical protein